MKTEPIVLRCQTLYRLWVYIDDSWKTSVLWCIDTTLAYKFKLFYECLEMYFNKNLKIK